jgi:hypothetical protein
MSEASAVLGGRSAVASMVAAALTPAAEAPRMADGHWVAQTADRVLAAMEKTRSTWQMWHVRAEAQRQIRTIDVPAEHAAALVDLLVDEVLDHRCIAIAAPPDGIEEPDALRRVDGSSVYTVAGADLYTSQRILDAERRLVTVAGIRGGTLLDRTVVDLALLEMAANGTALDPGQASLVRQMCTSGARLQLAIAPAGAGKTTAMRALTLAWTEDGGQVLGLAPSAAAAAVLAEETGIPTDTLAKLTWSLDHGDLPDWATEVGPATLIIIDEAGMADTLSLDTAVRFAIGRGASVRLIGDDQQLAAIGAGGVLRDIKHSHGALQLTELHRFADPAEAQASLTLREGDPSALGFYLDHGRVHVGDLAKVTDDAFAAWVQDRSAGLDAIMLAPTRELVAELNRRARDHRHDGTPAGPEARLGDGNQACRTARAAASATAKGGVGDTGLPQPPSYISGCSGSRCVVSGSGVAPASGGMTSTRTLSPSFCVQTLRTTAARSSAACLSRVVTAPSALASITRSCLSRSSRAALGSISDWLIV